MEEIWKDVKNYEGIYLISSLGRIRSVDREVSYYRGITFVQRIQRGRLLIPYKNAYMCILLHKDKFEEVAYIPRLVLNAFSNDCPQDCFYHLDHDVTNNRIENLRWGHRDLGPEWKPVPNTNNILWASIHGDLYERTHVTVTGSIQVEGFLRPCLESDGYLHVSRNYLGNIHDVHRIIATTFLPNTKNKLTVNHIDGNKTNNKVSNLEWVTMKEQVDHAFRIGLRKSEVDLQHLQLATAANSYRVKCLNTGDTYASIASAAKAVGVSAEGLRTSIVNKRPMRCGLQFVRV